MSFVKPYEDENMIVPSKDKAEMICKDYEVDPFYCLSCGDWMRIISFIEGYREEHPPSQTDL